MAVRMKNTVAPPGGSGLPKLRNWVLDERLAMAEILGPEARLAKGQPSPGRAGYGSFETERRRRGTLKKRLDSLRRIVQKHRLPTAGVALPAINRLNI